MEVAGQKVTERLYTLTGTGIKAMQDVRDFYASAEIREVKGVEV